MPIKRRLELVDYSIKNGSLVIEDDYENEFLYNVRPTPSLYALGKGNIIYIGSFSAMLLPGIRVSFMVLTKELTEKYEVPVLPVNCLDLDENKIREIISKILFCFPVKEIKFEIPKWINSLENDDRIKDNIFKANNIICLVFEIYTTIIPLNFYVFSFQKNQP